MIETMAPNIRNYAKPRPFWLMVTGDTMIYLGTSITSMGIFADNHTMAYVSLGCSVAGYFCTKLFNVTQADAAVDQNT
jgi:hypothetical protein